MIPAVFPGQRHLCFRTTNAWRIQGPTGVRTARGVDRHLGPARTKASELCARSKSTALHGGVFGDDRSFLVTKLPGELPGRAWGHLPFWEVIPASCCDATRGIEVKPRK